MKVRFTLQSKADLTSIADYFETQNVAALPKILSDIEAKISLIKNYPEIGREQQDRSVRKAITRRYRYIIHYRVVAAMEEIHILAIRHFRQARPFENN
jgi:addiction module RelE/StbE family toxin